MSKSITTDAQTTVTTTTIEEVEMEETTNATETVNKIPSNASLEDKQNFAINARNSGTSALLKAIPEEYVLNFSEEELNAFLAASNLLDMSELDRILVKSFALKQAKRDASGVLTGYKTDSANIVDVSMYVPLDWTEEKIRELLTV